MSDVTRILDRVQQGDPQAAEELLPLVYEELRKLAAVRMTNEQPGQTLQPTALVHVEQGPASSPLTRYTTSFDGENTVCIEIPTLGFNVTADSGQSGTGPRVLLQFRTFSTVKYEIRRRNSLSDPGAVVPFSTTLDGAAATSVLTGKAGTASVYVDRTAEGAFYIVAIQVKKG